MAEHAIFAGRVLAFPAAPPEEGRCFVAPGYVTGVEPCSTELASVGAGGEACRIHLGGSVVVAGVSAEVAAEAIARTIAGHSSEFSGWTPGTQPPPVAGALPAPAAPHGRRRR